MLIVGAFAVSLLVSEYAQMDGGRLGNYTGEPVTVRGSVKDAPTPSVEQSGPDATEVLASLDRLVAPPPATMPTDTDVARYARRIQAAREEWARLPKDVWTMEHEEAARVLLRSGVSEAGVDIASEEGIPDDRLGEFETGVLGVILGVEERGLDVLAQVGAAASQAPARMKAIKEEVAQLAAEGLRAEPVYFPPFGMDRLPDATTVEALAEATFRERYKDRKTNDPRFRARIDALRGGATNR